MRWTLLVAAGFLLGPGLSGCLGAEDAGPATEGDGATTALPLSPVRFDSRVRDTFDLPSSIDQVPLRVDVYRPPGDGPFPTILVLSPYWSFGGDAKASETPAWYIDYFVPRGYAVALGEMRGTRMSGGCWDFGGRLDQMDGHDIVERLAAMPWSNGKVGMLGQSHVGMSQLAAAITNPPHLTTIVPIAAVSDWYRYLHKDGTVYVINRGTPPAYFAVHASPATPPVGPEGTTPDWVLTQAQTACADNVEHLAKAGDTDGDKDAYWQERDLIAGAGNVTASVFMVHGFRDENVKTDHFLDFWDALPPTVEKKAWFGQWYHEHPSFEEWRTDLHQWYDHWLMGIDNGILDEPRIVVQDNVGWDDSLGYNPLARNSTAWPPTDVRDEAYMLDGEALRPPAAGTETDTVSYLAVPGDDRSGVHLSQPYVTTFRTEPRDQPLHLAGEALLHLTGSLDGPSGHWIAVLYDEAPGGLWDEVSRAYLDARHREGLAAGQDVPAGPHDYTLRFYPRDHVVDTGHRLVLALLAGDMGCNAPYSTGDAGVCEGTGILPADRAVTHTVETGPGSATRLVLPVTDEPAGAWQLTRLSEWIEDQPP
jgi:X-Pro dipeptidyl-peptidase